MTARCSANSHVFETTSLAHVTHFEVVLLKFVAGNLVRISNFLIMGGAHDLVVV